MRDKKTLWTLAIINLVVFGSLLCSFVTDSSTRTAVSNLVDAAWSHVAIGTGMLFLFVVGMVLVIRNNRDNDEIDNDDNDIDSTRGMDMDTLYNFTYFGYSDDK